MNLHKIILPSFQKWYEDAKNVIDKDSIAWKDMKESIYSNLVSNGTIRSKWKSEKALFKIVKKNYVSAIYQHRPEWLSPQSLDIFIPDKKIAIEYHGIQHYKSVDFFGGEEKFKRRVFLDNEKRRKCTENEIKLIEWSYEEEINESKLKKKIAELCK